MSFSIELPQTYTFSLCIDQGNRTLADTTFEVPATTEGVAKARRTIRHLMNEYAPAIKTMEPVTHTLIVGDETGPVPTASTWEHFVKKAGDQKRDDQAEVTTAPPPEKKPDGARGLLRLRCPECGNTFWTFLREYQTEVACKCGHSINLTGQLAEAEVSKVGRRYVTIREGRQETRFYEPVNSTTYLVEDKNYGAKRLLFLSTVAVDEYNELNDLRSWVQEATNWLKVKQYTLAQLREVKKILGGGEDT